MSGFLFALLATLVAGLAARDQALVAALRVRQGPRVAILATAIAVSVLSAGLAAWAARAMLPMMPPDARRLFAAMALALAGIECIAIMPPPAPEEPTRSLAAMAIVLLAQQVLDAARFLILAIAIGTAAPLTAGLGGAIGGAASVGLGWGGAPWLGTGAARTARRFIGVGLVLIGAVVALAATGLL